MAEITMPKMSDTMEEGRIVRWLKREGDQVHEGEAIAEIETDKANVEMEAFEPGLLGKIIVGEGESVPVGQAIATIEAPETAAAKAAPPVAPPEGHPEIPLTKAPEPGTTEQVPMVTAPSPAQATQPAPGIEEKQPAPAEEEERVRVSPLARRMAEEHGIDLAQVRGTGPDGRITESDIEAILQTAEAPPTAKEAPAPPKPEVHPPTEVPYEEVELSRMRKTIGERLSHSKQSIPHFYVTNEIEMDWAAHVRDELNADESLPRISFTDLVVKACALALAKFPSVNSSLRDGKMLLHKEINVGLVVALEDGLLVPVVHNADRMPLRDIAARTRDLARRARENKLHMSEYAGGTFTVSNLGLFDVESFESIINPPEAAALAVGTITSVPVVIDDQVAVSKRMKATISADHRLLDGAIAARFLKEVKDRLESPIGLL